MNSNSTIAAIATPPGIGAIAVIRINGPLAISICEKVFRSAKKGKRLAEQFPYTIHFGSITDGDKIIDQVLVSLFKAPNSYTGDDLVEISCHGSPYIQQRILELLIQNGAEMAQPGEFTLRAFLNGKIDLSQAEAVADLIASTGDASRRVALNQIRGGFSSKLKELRDQLLHFISLVELELDFSEEDVEFANRNDLANLLKEIRVVIEGLIHSFQLGNVIKTGIPVAIVGKPNVGKSTLLNKLLNEERSIVSDIAGTTRDTIEDTISIGGIVFRFVDTAGIRHTTDTIESLGIERTYAKISQSLVVILLIDAREDEAGIINHINEVALKLTSDQRLVVLLNKADLVDPDVINKFIQIISIKYQKSNTLSISAKHNQGISLLKNLLFEITNLGKTSSDEVIVTNARHYNSLARALDGIILVEEGLQTNLTGDLLAVDIRQVLYYLGEITGEITTDDILGSIFSKFCIGK